MTIRQQKEIQRLDYGWERILIFYKAKLENELQKQYVSIRYEQAKVYMEACSKTKIKEAYELLNKQIDKLEIKLISQGYPANIYQEFCREYNSDLKSTFEIQTPYAVVQGNDLYKWAKQLKNEKGYDLAYNQIVSNYFPDEKNTENKLFSICKKSQTERLKEYCLDIIELLHQSQENDWTPLHTDQINPEYLKDRKKYNHTYVFILNEDQITLLNQKELIDEINKNDEKYSSCFRIHKPYNRHEYSEIRQYICAIYSKNQKGLYRVLRKILKQVRENLVLKTNDIQNAKYINKLKKSDQIVTELDTKLYLEQQLFIQEIFQDIEEQYQGLKLVLYDSVYPCLEKDKNKAQKNVLQSIEEKLTSLITNINQQMSYQIQNTFNRQNYILQSIEQCMNIDLELDYNIINNNESQNYIRQNFQQNLRRDNSSSNNSSCSNEEKYINTNRFKPKLPSQQNNNNDTFQQYINNMNNESNYIYIQQYNQNNESSYQQGNSIIIDEKQRFERQQKQIESQKTWKDNYKDYEKNNIRQKNFNIQSQNKNNNVKNQFNHTNQTITEESKSSYSNSTQSQSYPQKSFQSHRYNNKQNSSQNLQQIKLQKELQNQYEKQPQENLHFESQNELEFSKISEVSNEQDGLKVQSKLNQSKIFSQESMLQKSIIQNSEIRDEFKQSVLQ